MRSKDARKARAVTRRANVKHGRLRRMVDYSTRRVYRDQWNIRKYPVNMLDRYQPIAEPAEPDYGLYNYCYY